MTDYIQLELDLGDIVDHKDLLKSRILKIKKLLTEGYSIPECSFLIGLRSQLISDIAKVHLPVEYKRRKRVRLGLSPITELSLAFGISKAKICNYLGVSQSIERNWELTKKIPENKDYLLKLQDLSDKLRIKHPSVEHLFIEKQLKSDTSKVVSCRLTLEEISKIEGIIKNLPGQNSISYFLRSLILVYLEDSE